VARFCDFCQVTHSANSCFHPGKARLEAAEQRVKELEEAVCKQDGSAGLELLDRYSKRIAELEAEKRDHDEEFREITNSLAELADENERLNQTWVCTHIHDDALARIKRLRRLAKAALLEPVKAFHKENRNAALADCEKHGDLEE
jgi:hypothetical protein